MIPSSPDCTRADNSGEDAGFELAQVICGNFRLDGRRSSEMRTTEEWRPVWRQRGGVWLLLVLPLLVIADTAHAQGPQVDIDTPPGSPEGRGRLGPALGSSGTSGFDVAPITQQESIFGGRPGPSVTR